MTPACPSSPARDGYDPYHYTVRRSTTSTGSTSGLDTFARALLADADRHVRDTVHWVTAPATSGGPTRAAADITLDGLSTVAHLEVTVTPPPAEMVPRSDRRLRAALLDAEDHRATPGSADTYSVQFVHDNAYTRRDEATRR